MLRAVRRLCLLVACLAAACGDDAGGVPDANPLPAWDRELPSSADVLGMRRGLTPVRGIIHLHSPYSHDACDGKPRENETGPIDEECLADLRAALCDLRVDFAALTDHDGSMAQEDYDTLFLVRDNDDPIRNTSGAIVANQIRCPNGHTVQITVGGENDLMPIMVDRHPDGTIEERAAIWDKGTAQNVQTFRDLGGMVTINHSEGHSTDSIRTIAPEGMEIYNLHANIDPDIREEDLGLDGAEAIRNAVEFADTGPTGPEPDLTLISFLSPNAPAVATWNTLLGEGTRIFGLTGSDAHQNALPITLRDGERGDGYRRMLRWASNHALVADPTDPAAIESAVAAGRFFVIFELFGTPTGLDVVARGATDAEMGDDITVADGATFEMTVPTVYALDPSLPAPTIRGRLIRVDASGQTEIAEGAGPTLSAPMDQPGAYRAEVLITPSYLGPYLRRLGPADAEREHVWVYSNAIYVAASSN
jgi:hypothetical protein